LRAGGGGGGGGGEEASPSSSSSSPPAAAAARLEYYESEKKWRSKASAPKRAIALDACLNIHKRADAKHKHLIALYTRDETFALAAESEAEQEAWFQEQTELLRDSQAAGQGTQKRLGPAAAPAYREVWQVTLKAKGLGQSRHLTGVHRLCLAARTVGLVRLNCERPCVTLQLMNIRRCGHSDSFFFMELGRSAATGPGELWMQADDAVVAQNIHETILEAMKALRELAEFRPRSKSQSSSSSSSSGGAAVAGGGFSAVGSRPISVPGRRHHHHHHHPPSLVALPPSQTGILRRSRTDTLAAAGGGGSGGGGRGSNSSRARTASEGDGGRGGSLAGSPLSPDAGRTLLSRSHTLGTASSSSSSSSSGRSGRSLALGHSPSLLSKLALEPGLLSKRPSSSSASASGSPSDPAAFMAFEDLSSSPGGDPRPFSSSSTASNHSNTPETPPGQQLDGYMAMERGRLCYRPYLWDNAPRADKAPRKRTYSLTTPAHQRPLPLPLSSASLDEYTLMRATVPATGASSRTAYNPYPEDYCDLEIGSGGTSSSSSSHLGPSDGAEESYMPMSPGVASALPGKPCSNPYMPMSPTSVSAPQQILQPRSYKTSSESSPDDSGYMRMWGPGARLSGESTDGCLGNGDYLNMSPVQLHGPSTASASPLPSPDGFGVLGPGGRPSCLCGPLTHASQSRPSSLGQEKDSDQYVHMNSLAGRLIQAPKGETSCNHIVMPLPLRHSQTDSSLSQQARMPAHSGMQPSHRSLGTLLLGRSKEPFPGKLQCPGGGDYVSLGYAVAPPGGLFSLRSGLGGPPGSLLSNYMNLNLNGSHSGAVSVGSVEDVLLQGSCPSLGQPDEHYLKMEMGVACLSSPSSEVGDYAEVAFSTATTPPQPISHKPESPRVASPVAGLKRLTISGVEAFLFANPPPDPDHGAKVIRVDPQGRRRHSSETFSSTTTVTPVSPSFAHVPKRHNSASVENVSLRKNEGFVEEQNSSPMCRETSAGFQNGLNYIAVDGEGDHLANGSQARHLLNRSINDTYASMDFLAHNGKEAASVKVC
ncbi:PREDICTED: LOW QUALITY PROTEIN: insulin receptor substrate 2-like, partial [Gekko japonicus]|uniref:LOW QUALITY PROTEIN: insulin receptor substrate 2-like n=1 Tax=Gekko japonicus TaxID=146911 RepID=A0ABM1KZ63_GEKJA